MRKNIKLFFILMLMGIVFFGCNHGLNPNADVGSFKNYGDYVKVFPAPLGIEGRKNWNPAFVESGVFIKDRTVILSPFCVSKYEVTYKLWTEVFEWAKKNGYTFLNNGTKGSSGNGSENEPVTGISWIDAVVWCNAYTQKEKGSDTECVYRKSLSDKTVLKDATDSTKWNTVYFYRKKTGFRLPTEAEWEYAARWQGKNSKNAEGYGNTYLTKLNSASGAAGKGEKYSAKVAWHKETRTKTEPVGQLKANMLGIYDMSGNVWEFCFDKFVENIKTGQYLDPVGTSNGTKRAFRGGGWHCPYKLICVGARRGYEPDEVVTNNTWGFRVFWND